MKFRAALCATVFALSVAAAQEGHGVSPADLDRGMQLFLNNCAGCHGSDGDLVSGVNLSSGQFRRAQSDADIRRIVVKGIPGTAMPPGNYTDDQAGVIVAFLRSMTSSGARPVAAGDPARGKAIVVGRGQCLGCHRIGRLGTITGPDLTGIGRVRRPVTLRTALVDPDAEIRPDNLTLRAVDREGKEITGRLLNMDTYSFQVLDSRSEKLRTLNKDQLREYDVLKKSPMPSYRDKLSEQEISDVVAYLLSLKENL